MMLAPKDAEHSWLTVGCAQSFKLSYRLSQRLPQSKSLRLSLS
jgi:hypothetical protein